MPTAAMLAGEFGLVLSAINPFLGFASFLKYSNVSFTNVWSISESVPCGFKLGNDADEDLFIHI
jgi:hypothetical protein